MDNKSLHMKYCYLFFLVFAVLISFSSCEGLESDFEEMEEYAEEESEYCFEFVFPVTITLPDGSTYTGNAEEEIFSACLLYTSPSPRDRG